MEKTRTLIKNGRVIDPANNLDVIRDVLIEKGSISKVAEGISATGTRVIDARGKIVMPGIIDMHVHLREPGREDKETVATGTDAALRGGVTTVLAMPNTTPTMDTAASVKILKDIITNTARINVLICGSITDGRMGKKVVDSAALKKAGVVALSDDGASVDSSGVMQEALQKARLSKLPVLCHCEDKALSGHGVVNRGFISTRLGLRGISKESEFTRVSRDIELARKTGAPVHIMHVSCAESVDIIAKAKKKGVKVTCETAPHYFALTQEAVLDYDTNMKMNPPLRTRADVAAIKAGLKSGVIDVIASDHAPHTENEKDIEFDRAEFGVIGLETTLSVSVTELVHTGVLNWSEIVRKLTVNPARILGLDRGTLTAGAPADVVVIDPAKEWVVRKEEIRSKSKNSPFLGKTLKGSVEYTICSGKIVYQR
jgi:dihydroorotase